jgi:hypothetical protein
MAARTSSPAGSAFADTLTGDTRANRLNGAGGDDTLTGGAGADVLSGAGGADAIDSVDGEVDEVACGDGADGLRSEAWDLLAPDCADGLPGEPGTRQPAPPPAGSGPGPAPGAGAPGLVLGVRRQSGARVLRRGLRVRATCRTGCAARRAPCCRTEPAGVEAVPRRPPEAGAAA